MTQEQNSNARRPRKKAGALHVVLKVFSLVLSGVVVAVVLKLFNFSHEPVQNTPQQPQKEAQYFVRVPALPDSLTFAGDPVPLHNFDVRESLEDEILSVMFFHSQTLKNLKRTTRYFPVIEPILKKNGVPEDFKFLAIAESNLTNAVSPAGARGVWQFMTSTAKSYGMEVSGDVDERYHLEKATKAACQYLKRSYRKYKDWALVAAAYNYGEGNVDKQLARQKVNSYYDMLLNRETARYVFRILAIKLVYSDPVKYGLVLRKQDYYAPIPTYEVEVDSSVSNWADFAAKHKTNYKLLKYFNPWLRDSKLSNSAKKTYKIKLPKKGYRNIEKIWEANGWVE